MKPLRSGQIKLNINIDKYNQKASAINVFINSKYSYYSNYDDGIGYICRYLFVSFGIFEVAKKLSFYRFIFVR